MEFENQIKRRVFIAPQKGLRVKTIFNRYVAGKLNKYSIEKDCVKIEKQFLLIQAYSLLKMQHPLFNMKFYEHEGKLYIPHLSSMMRVMQKPTLISRRDKYYYDGLKHYDELVESVFRLSDEDLNKYYEKYYTFLKGEGWIKKKNPHVLWDRLKKRYMNGLMNDSFIAFIRFMFLPMFLFGMVPAFIFLIIVSVGAKNPILSLDDFYAGLFFIGLPTLYYVFGLFKILRKGEFEKQFD